MVYLSYYEEYPIYEPAEGGYCYSGLELVESERLSKHQAKKLFDEKAKELMNEGNWMRCNPKFGRSMIMTSKYVGEGARFCIERRQGMYKRGRVPYC